ncbi:hypothetical protein L1887_16597 [Cichorium endivia]|nr:hypothetical protein L1887_16597 [Cichorium endivia]
MLVRTSDHTGITIASYMKVKCSLNKYSEYKEKIKLMQEFVSISQFNLDIHFSFKPSPASSAFRHQSPPSSPESLRQIHSFIRQLFIIQLLYL